MTTLLSQWVTRYPKRIVAAMLFLVALLGVGAPGLQNTLDYRFFFSDDNPELAAYEELQDSYVRSEAVYIAVEALTGDVFQPQVLKALEEITEACWKVPYNLRVDSLTNFQYTESNEEGFEVNDLFSDAMNMSPRDIEKRKSFALKEPSLVNVLVSSRGDVAGFQLAIQVPGIDREKETPEVVFYVRNMAKEFEQKYPFLKFHFAGQVIVDQAFPESTNKDLSTVWPVFMVVMIILLTLIFRSGWYTFSVFLIGILSVISGMGALGWMQLKINAAVSAAPLIILTLALADSIHIIASYTQYLKQGKDKAAAISESLKVNFVPVLITSLMTCIGFLTLHFNDSPPYRALGYVVTAGVLSAWMYSVVLLPALLMLLPHKVPAPDRNQNDSSRALISGLSRFIVSRSKQLSVIIGIFAILLIASISKNVINDDPGKYFGESQTMRKDMDFINTRITGLGALNYSIESGKAQGITDIEYLRRVEAFVNWLKQQPHVIQVDSVVEILKRINKSWHADSEAFYRLPESKEEASQFLLVYELSLPVGMDINNMITLDKSASRVRVIMDDTSGNYHINLDEAAKQWLDINLPENYDYLSASSTLMFAHIGERSIDGILKGLIGSLFLIALILMALFRSVRAGIISIVCNVLPIGMAFGVWGLINGQVDLGLTVTLAIAFGIVVDDTIHLLSKYQLARQDLGMAPKDALYYALNTVGLALIVTTLVLLAGFSILAFSAMNITANMGLLTTITILLALLVDFFGVPGLLLLFDKDKSRSD